MHRLVLCTMTQSETFHQAVTRLRRVPPADQLQRLCDAVAGGGHVARVRRLPGGLQCGMHAVDLVATNGERLHLVVRRYTPQQAEGDPGVCRREWQTLTLLAHGGAPAPRPVFLDGDGAIFGTPTLVMTRLAGHAFVSFPARMDPWLEQLAGALAAIHGTDTRWASAAHLPHFTGERTAGRPSGGEETDRRVAALPHGAEILRVLRDRRPPPLPTSPVLVHGDFFTGNTVWHRTRLSGIVDWGEAKLGPREIDLSSARLDLALLAGPEAADLFLARYAELSGHSASDMPRWDLTAVWGGALLLDLWWEALCDVGVTISRAELGCRLDAFALRALAHLS